LTLLPNGNNDKDWDNWSHEMDDLISNISKDISLEDVLKVFKNKIEKHNMRQRAAITPAGRIGTPLRCHQGLKLSSKIYFIQGIKYCILSPDGAGAEEEGGRESTSTDSRQSNPWVTVLFEDSQGREMVWRVRPHWLDSLSSCFRSGTMEVNQLQFNNDVSKCFFAVLLLHLGVVRRMEERRA